MKKEQQRKLICEIGKSLKSLGIYPNLCGYRYITDIVVIGVSGVELFPITKVGYKLVADKNNTTVCRVERGIRHAIELAEERAPISRWEELFCNDFKKEMTNSEFVSVLVERYSYFADED